MRGYEHLTAPSYSSSTDPRNEPGKTSMPSLTDGVIQQALKRVKKSRKQETLTDGEGRGTGRLGLVLQPMPTRVTADWMAQQWRDGRGTKSKIGSYPPQWLSDAR